MNDFVSKIINNRILMLFIVALLIFGLCKLTGLNLTFSVGASGIHFGIDS